MDSEKSRLVMKTWQCIKMDPKEDLILLWKQLILIPPSPSLCVLNSCLQVQGHEVRDSQGVEHGRYRPGSLIRIPDPLLHAKCESWSRNPHLPGPPFPRVQNWEDSPFPGSPRGRMCCPTRSGQVRTEWREPSTILTMTST